MNFGADTTAKRSGPSRWSRNGWTIWHLLAGLVLVSAAVAVTGEAWRDIVNIGLVDEEASHIFLVPVLSAWLIWVRRGRLRTCRPENTFIGPVLIAVGWLFYAFGDFYQFQVFWHGGAVMMLVGSLLSVAGSSLLRKLLPAFIVLFFLVPVPGLIRQTIALPLQTVTAKMTHGILEFVGTEVGLSGNVLRINGIDVAIDEACNGMRMVFALVLVSYAFAYSTPLREHVRFIVLAASPLSAILCNVVRLVPTVWIYGNYERSIGDWFHDISGWIMLPIAFIFLMGIIRALRWALIPVTRFTLAYGS
ncbi:MAG: exosortase/archaeosortase family protein [Planctomycetota bacterium]|jgi:exosortase